MHHLRRPLSRFATTWALLVMGCLAPAAVSAQIVFQDNLPCASRRDFNSCFAECKDLPGPGEYLQDCFCLWDERVDASKPCPDGETCCFNMPCARWDQQGSLQCLRGGGSLDALTPKNCDYHPDGNGGGLCQCTPPLVQSTYDYADFSVVNSIDFLLPPFDCVCPYTTDEQWLRLGVCNPPGVKKLTAKVNFAKPLLHDSIQLAGGLSVPNGFTVAGATLVVNVGGVVKTFGLDEHGKARLDHDQVHLAVKATHGTVLAQDARLTVHFNKGTFAAPLAVNGLVNQTVTNVAVALPVEIRLNDTMFARSQALTYSATASKSGVAK